MWGVAFTHFYCIFSAFSNMILVVIVMLCSFFKYYSKSSEPFIYNTSICGLFNNAVGSSEYIGSRS
jgi:hypothetical protein